MPAGATGEVENAADFRRRDRMLDQRDDALRFGRVPVRVKRDVLLAEPSLEPLGFHLW